MSEWKKVKLGEVCEISAGGDRPQIFSNHRTDKCRIPIYSNGIDNEGLYGFTDTPKNNGNAITITGRGANAGTVFYRKDPFLSIIRLLTLTPNSEIINAKYLFYLLKNKTFLSTGSAQPQITVPNISQFEIEFNPDIETQHRVATILSRYDSLIENYQKQIKLLEEAAQRLYKEWFVDLRFPGHENTNIIDGVPDGWEKKTIDDVTCKVTTGLNPRKNFVLGKGSNYYVTIKNMADNTLFLDDRCDRVDNEALEKINKRSDLKIGDILFSGIGTIGRVALVYIPTNNWNVSESVFTLRANDIVTKEFLYLMLLSPDMQNYCQSNAHGAAQKGIRMADLKAYSFNLPPFGVIQKFTNLVTPTIKKVSSIRNQIRLLTEARDRLLPKLMSGEIAV